MGISELDCTETRRVQQKERGVRGEELARLRYMENTKALNKETAMVMIKEMYCDRCEKKTLHNFMMCRECEQRACREKVAKWNALTVDERLKDIRKRLEKLEERPARY